MRHVERSAIVPFSAATMFKLVADVEAYPRFLPGCVGAAIESSDGEYVTVTLRLARGPLTTAFTTRNEMRPPLRIGMQLVAGPFRELQGGWEFQPLGEAGCRIALVLSFSFANAVKDLLLGPAFETQCNELVDSFVARARQLHDAG